MKISIKSSSRMLLICSLVVNVMIASAGAYFVHKKGGITYLKTKAVSTPYDEGHYYQHRLNMFEHYKPTPEDIVMLGDSLTDYGEWQELFPGSRIINRGIAMEQANTLLKRLQQIGKPKKIFILIGINDISHGRSVDDVINDYSSIIDKLRELSPSTNVYVQSVLPVNNNIGGFKVDISKIESLNARLQEVCRQKEATYIDLKFGAELNEDYTSDGVHLNGNGYAAWRKSIEQYVLN